MKSHEKTVILVYHGNIVICLLIREDRYRCFDLEKQLPFEKETSFFTMRTS